MNTAITDRRRRAAAGLLLGGALLAAAGLCYWRLTPRVYAASATVRVWKSSANFQTNHAGTSFNLAATLPGECQFIRSPAVLDPVVVKLNLNELWGRRYHQGVALASAESRQRLLTTMTAEPAAEAGIITVTVWTGDDPGQAAAIANEIVREYSDQREQEQAELARAPLVSMAGQVAELDAKINEAESNLSELAQRINYGPATNSLKYFSPALYATAQSNRAVWQAEYDAQKRLVAELKTVNGPALVAAAAPLDNPTNAVLAPAVKQWTEAKSRLADLQTTQGANSPDVRGAEAAANELGTIAEQTARSLVTVREAQLGGMAAKLGALNAELRGVTTNLEEFVAGHPDYRDAQAKFQELKARRADLQQQLMALNPADTAPLTTLITKVVELADAPSQPATPNRYVAIGLVGAGLFFGVIGAAVQFVKPAKKPMRASRR